MGKLKGKKRERTFSLFLLVENNSIEINSEKEIGRGKKGGNIYIYRGKKVERRLLTSPGNGKRLLSPCSCPE